MSNKGNKLSVETKGKIALSNTKLTNKLLTKLFNDYINYLNENEKQLPSVVNFCVLSGINSTYLYELSLSNPQVTEILNNIRQLQENYCLSRGITNQANPIFSMFLLKSKHDYKDNPQNLTQNNNFNISPDLLADALKLMNKDK